MVTVIRQGCIVPQTVETEVTENGRYPVTGEAVHDAIAGSAVGPATEETAGLVKMASNVAEAAGEAPTAAEFNALLDALIAAGIMAEPEPEPEDPEDPENPEDPPEQEGE